MRKKLLLVAVLVAAVLCSAIWFVSCKKPQEDSHTHDFKVVSTVEATCTTEGVTNYKCDCGETKQETSPALGHTGGTATCKEKAVCTRCNNAYGELGDHSWDKDAATCTEGRECSVCNKTEPALGHTGGTPTCKEKAVCTRCNNEYGELGDHSWNKESVTCTEGRECTVCHTAETASGHRYVVKETVAATCTKEGKKVYECENGCGAGYEEITDHAKGHSVTDDDFAETTKELSSTKEVCYVQKYEATCSDCGDKIEKSVEVKEHATVKKITKEADCRNHGKYEFKCSHCEYSYTEDYEDGSAHKWSDTGVEAEGVTTYSCTVTGCDESRTVISAKNSTDTTTDAETLKKAGEVELKEASIALDEKTLENISGQVSISADTVNESELSEAQKEAIKGLNGKVYNFTMTVDEEEHHEFGGKVTVKIPYTLEEGDDPDNLVVCYLNDEGELVKQTAKYSNGFAVFETEHFSYYTVTRMTAKERCEKFGHVESETEAKPTCSATGYTLVVCKRCGEMKKTIIPALGHSYGEPEITAATCTKNGSKKYTCEREGCGYSYITAIRATGHNWEKDEVKEATCTEAGYEKYVCKNDGCRETYSKTLAKTEHDYKETVVEPTCTEGGYTLHECSFCHKQYTDKQIGKLGHKENKTVVKATCTEDGYTEYKCSRCGKTRTEDVVKAHHTWDIEAPTCGKGQTCTACGAAGLPATGEHKYDDSGVCSVCGAGCEHNFEEVEVVDPTCTEQGYTVKKCSKCKIEEKVNYTNALGHKPGKDGKCSVCGAEVPVAADPMKNFILSYLNAEVTVVIKNADFDIPVDYNESTKGKIEFAELIVSLDENGELVIYGKANVIINATEEITLANNATVIVKGGYAYVQLDSDLNRMGSTNGAQYIVVGDNKGYVKCPVEEMFGDSEQGKQFAILAELLRIYKDKVTPLIAAAAEIDDGVIRKLFDKIVEDTFDITETANGYEALLSFEKLSALNHKLATKCMYELVDETFGSGSFDSVSQFMSGALDKTLGELYKDLKDKAIDVDGMFDVIDELYLLFNGEVEEGAFMPSDIIAMAKSDKYSSEKVGKLLVDSMAGNTGEMTEEDLAEHIRQIRNSIEQYFSDLKNMDFYTFLDSLGGKKEKPDENEDYDKYDAAEENPASEKSAEEQISQVLDIIKGMVEVKVVADGDGNFLSASVSVNAENLDGKNNGMIFGTISFINNYEAETDFDKEYEDIAAALSAIDFKAVAEELIKNIVNPTYTYDERSGCLVATDERMLQAKESSLMNELNNAGYTVTVKQSGTGMIKLDDFFTVTEDCNDAVILQIVAKIYEHVQYEVKLYYNGTEISEYEAIGEKLFKAISEAFGINVEELGVSEDEYVIKNNVTAIYDKATKNVLLDNGGMSGDFTNHKWEKVESLSKPATCNTFGENHYKCKNCNKTYVEYYTLEHEQGEVEWDFLTEKHDCSEGVEIKYHCKNCHEVYRSYRTYSHYEIEKEIDISDKDVCDKHRVAELSCPCGEEQSFRVYDDSVRDEWNRECELAFLESDENGSIRYYTCFDCGFTVYKKYTDSKENCVRHSVTTYTVGKVNRAAESEYQTVGAQNYNYGMEEIPGFAPVCSEGNLFKVTAESGQKMFVFKPTKAGRYYIRPLFTKDEPTGVYNFRAYTESKGWDYGNGNGESGITTELDAGEWCMVRFDVMIDEATVIVEPDYYSGAHLDESFCDPMVNVTDREDHDEEYYVELAEGSESCYDGVYLTSRCRDCGKLLRDKVLEHDHIYGIIKQIRLDEYGVAKTIIIRGCACGWRGEEIYTPDGYEDYFEDVEDDGSKIEGRGYRKADGSYFYIAQKEAEEEVESCVYNTYRYIYLNYNKDDGSYSALEKIRLYTQYRHDYKYTLSEGSVTCADGIDAECVKCGAVVKDYSRSHDFYAQKVVDLNELGATCGGTFALMGCACGLKHSVYNNSKCEFRNISDEVWPDDPDIVYGEQVICGEYYFFNPSCSTYKCAVTDPSCKAGYRYASYWKHAEELCRLDGYVLYQFGIWNGNEFEVLDELFYKTNQKATYHNYEESNGRMTCTDCGSYYTDVQKVYEDGRLVEESYEWVNNLEDGNAKSYNEIIKYDVYGNEIYRKSVSVDANGFSVINIDESERIETVNGNVYYYPTLSLREYRNHEGVVTYSDKYEYDNDFADGCRVIVKHTQYWLESGAEEVEERTEYNHHYNSRTIKNPTCTQDGLVVYTCRDCGEQTDAQTTSANGHYWSYFRNKYICDNCGMENENGVSGSVILEDLTRKYGNGENYVLGYYIRDYGEEFTHNATLIVLDENGNIMNEIVFDGAVFTELTEVRALALSMASVKAFAEENGLSEGQYNLRISFVRIGGWDGNDYAVTFTDEEGNDMSDITGDTERLYVITDGEVTVKFNPETSGRYRFYFFMNGISFEIFNPDGQPVACDNYGDYMEFDFYAGKAYTVVLTNNEPGTEAFCKIAFEFSYMIYDYIAA